MRAENLLSKQLLYTGVTRACNLLLLLAPPTALGTCLHKEGGGGRRATAPLPPMCSRRPHGRSRWVVIADMT